MGNIWFLRNIQKYRVKYFKKSIIVFLFFITAHISFGMDFKITGKEMGFLFSPEYNRALNFCWDLSAAGTVKLNDSYAVKAGLALGSVGTVFEIKGFAGGEIALPVSIPLYIGLSYNYNGLPEYENHTHSLPLLFSYKGKRFGAALGINPRFSSFFGEPAVFEPIFCISLYVFIYKSDILQFKLEVSNFNDFTYKNFGAYFFKLNNIINLNKCNLNKCNLNKCNLNKCNLNKCNLNKCNLNKCNLNKQLALINEIELQQSGNMTLATNFYGIVYHGGVIFLW
jgi:hypothetical protein